MLHTVAQTFFVYSAQSRQTFRYFQSFSGLKIKYTNLDMSRKSVCIIGAGPCGIFAAKTIGEVADVVVYERSSVFGGQWVRTLKQPKT